MFLLRRTAAKALSAPASSFIVKSRAIPSALPTISRLQKQWALPSLQYRVYSIETETENTPSSSQPPTSASEQATNPTSSETAATETTSQDARRDPFEELNVPGAHARESGAQNSNGKAIYVGNLFFEVTEDQLHKLFSPFGQLEKVTLVCDNRGLSRGFGFVNFENAEDAQAAISSLHQQTFEGRRMVVQLHVPKARSTNFTKPLVANEPSKTLFIGNMSFEMSDKDLNDLFREIRNVLDVRVAIDRRTGQPRGFAHADFIDVESAAKAKQVLDQKVVYGRGLRVDFSQPGTNFRGNRS